jgi:FkbM family methyltransferase
VRTLLRRIFFYIINKLIIAKPFMFLYNYLYNRVPYKAVLILFRHIVIPNMTYNWKIKLDNGTNVITPIHKDQPDTAYFGMVYNWVSPVLNKLETILLEYFPTDTIWIDCGANLGLRSMAPLSRKLKVYMIEPNKEVNAINLERCILNKFDNYQILPFGVSNSDSEKMFFIDKSSFLSSLHKENIDEANIARNEIIQVRKLDTIFHELCKLNLNTVLKIDVEGHEKEALEGAENIINALLPTIIIEINSKDEEIKSVFQKMRHKGYEIFEISETIIDSKFLSLCPYDISNHTFKFSEFLFVNDKNLIKILDNYTNS